MLYKVCLKIYGFSYCYSKFALKIYVNNKIWINCEFQSLPSLYRNTSVIVSKKWFFSIDFILRVFVFFKFSGFRVILGWLDFMLGILLASIRISLLLVQWLCTLYMIFLSLSRVWNCVFNNMLMCERKIIVH